MPVNMMQVKKLMMYFSRHIISFPSPLRGEGEGGGDLIYLTLPFIPSPQGRGDINRRLTVMVVHSHG
jgi:hypothetical protein